MIILTFITYFIPISFGYIFKPALQDKYIIFVLIPIIILISSLIDEIESKKTRKIIFFLIVASTITNHLFEFLNEKIDKPNFNKIVQITNEKSIKNLSVITIDKIRRNMVDVKQVDPFKEREIIKNYLKEIKNFNKKIIIYNQDNIPATINDLFLVCYKPVVEYQCQKNIRIKKEFELVEKFSSYQVDAYLFKKKSILKK